MSQPAHAPRGNFGWLWAVLLCVVCSTARIALAEPYLAVQQGYKCIACHVNPTGGGLRNVFGAIFAENVMAARPLPEGAPVWTGQLLPDLLSIGGDLRADWSRTTTPQSPTLQQFALEQMRLYADVNLIPNGLALYVDEEVAPGAAQSMEAYVLYGNTSDWYLKAGRFYLAFGWRLQDQTAFVRQVTGINMNTPDNGIELGFERPNWEAQLDLSNGAANAQSGSGYQLTGQIIRTQSIWRFGIAGSYTQSSAGDREMTGRFAGLPHQISLGEPCHRSGAQAGYPNGTRSMTPAFAEMDWALRKGHNLKLTYEFYDPELSVPNNAQTRWSAVYELTPIPFLQARAGFRRYQGIPQNNTQNQTFSFLELHGFY